MRLVLYFSIFLISLVSDNAFGRKPKELSDNAFIREQPKDSSARPKASPEALNKSFDKPSIFVTLNNQNTCKVHIAAWLSPSCSHCAEYFSEDIPKITSLPGFCLDFHLVPYLYLLDKPVAILIASQGPENIFKNAAIFFKHQNDWLEKSASREKKEDREKDLQDFLNSIQKNTMDFNEIREYLEADDKFLYVKMFALQFFSIKHLKKYLPKGDEELINEISIALISNLPKKDDDIVKFSPFFTDLAGQLIPDEHLHNGILTPSVAEDMLKIVTSTINPSAKIATRANNISDEDDMDIQDADEDVSDIYDVDEGNAYDAEEDPELSHKLNDILQEIETGVS
ncbi:MAG: hypothetical protein ACK4V2_01945 [Pseudomonadota bacterium]|jgi:hypothetical protein|nr:hypothetical protein [Alphaproteobacteria bacterium]